MFQFITAFFASLSNLLKGVNKYALAFEKTGDIAVAAADVGLKHVKNWETEQDMQIAHNQRLLADKLKQLA